MVGKIFKRQSAAETATFGSLGEAKGRAVVFQFTVEEFVKIF